MRPVERRVLAQAAMLHPASEDIDRMIWFMLSKAALKKLVEEAIKEGLAGHLFRSFKKWGMLERIEESEKERLETNYYQTLQQNLRLILNLKELLLRASEQGVNPVLLQGIDLIAEVYEDIGLRPMSDIDLWILKSEYPRFAKILYTLGYEGDALYPNTFRRGSTTIDLHSQLLWADRIRARRFLLRKSDEEIYRDTRTFTCEGVEARSLNRNDRVIYLGLHGLKHRFSRLVWLADIQLITSGWNPADWEDLSERARQLGQPKLVSYLLFLLTQVFDYQPLAQARTPVSVRLNLLERRALMGRVKGDSLPLWAPPCLLSSGTNAKARIAFFMETLFPRPEILRQVFPSSPDASPIQLHLKRVSQIVRLFISFLHHQFLKTVRKAD